jgi:methylmalonyl-CoA mutase
LAGSYYVESLTSGLAETAMKLIGEVEEMGGMTRAVETGMPKMRIEEASALRQARIDRGEDVIVGVNRYQLAEESPIDILDIDNTAVREAQIQRIKKVRDGRDAAACEKALDALTRAAEDDRINLLELAIEAARARATVGEISYALEKVFGRHRATTRSITGVFGSAYEGDADFSAIQHEVNEFAKTEGRRPRMLVCKLGQDGHDRGAKVIATAFADIGFDVDIGPLFQTPEEAVREAIENDVHVIGISSQAAGHKTLVPKVIEGLRQAGADDIIVVCGGVIPPQDHDGLLASGVAAIFGPGTNILLAAHQVLGIIEKQRRN